MLTQTSPAETLVKQQLIDYLSSFMLEKRLEVIKHVLQNRTRYMTVVLENIFQSQNASAVIRTCDCFGVHDIHIIENNNPFNVNPKVVMGSTKWVNLYKYSNHNNNSIRAIEQLRKNGYRIVATSPHTYQTSLNDFSIEKGKFALFFGTELTGLSGDVMSNADEFMVIPTYGFTESLNISVSAAICIQTLSDRLRNSEVDYGLSGSEHQDLMLDWLRKSIKSWQSIEKRFYSNLGLETR